MTTRSENYCVLHWWEREREQAFLLLVVSFENRYAFVPGVRKGERVRLTD